MKKGAAVVLFAGIVAVLVLLKPAGPPPPPLAPPDPPAVPAPRKPRQKISLPIPPLPELVPGNAVPEVHVKAALLYQILSLTPWPPPEKESAPLLVGVLGISSVGDALHLTAMDKQIGQRRVRVLRGNGLDDLPTCHLLFIPEGWKQDWDLVLPAVRKPGVLIVGEEDGFLEAGGGMALRVEDRKIRYSMHLGNIRAGRVEPSIKLAERADPLLR